MSSLPFFVAPLFPLSSFLLPLPPTECDVLYYTTTQQRGKEENSFSPLFIPHLSTVRIFSLFEDTEDGKRRCVPPFKTELGTALSLAVPLSAAVPFHLLEPKQIHTFWVPGFAAHSRRYVVYPNGICLEFPLHPYNNRFPRIYFLFNRQLLFFSPLRRGAPRTANCMFSTPPSKERKRKRNR